MTFRDLITEKRVLAWAGSKSFARGKAYADDDRVNNLAEVKGAIGANVYGTETYRVNFQIKKGVLSFDCTCPVGLDRTFCKHCVAVALKWLEGAAASPRAQGNKTLESIEAYLAGLKPDELVGMILERAQNDPAYGQRLALEAAEASGSVDIAVYRELFKSALGRRGFVDYRQAREYARGAREAIDTLERIVLPKNPEGAMELAEYGLKLVEGVTLHMDDSDGYSTELMERLVGVHFEACIAARPDPVKLAHRLFEWELNGEWDVFAGAAFTYAEILGNSGIAEYRKSAEANWREVPALLSGEREMHDSKRFRITRVMEGLAMASGSLEELVSVMSRDLGSEYAFLRIAHACRDAGDLDRAIEWTERGIASFTGSNDRRLQGFLSEILMASGRVGSAIELVWRDFEAAPGLREYQRLHAYASKAEAWSLWRHRALDALRADVEREKTSHNRWVPADHSRLVEVFLWEGDVESAWAEAKAGNCQNRLWLQLAELRASTEPDSSIRLFKAHVAETLKTASDSAYQEAVGTIRRIGQIMVANDQEDEFKSYVETLRLEQKRRPNFMKFLDRGS